MPFWAYFLKLLRAWLHYRIFLERLVHLFYFIVAELTIIVPIQICLYFPSKLYYSLDYIRTYCLNLSHKFQYLLVFRVYCMNLPTKFKNYWTDILLILFVSLDPYLFWTLHELPATRHIFPCFKEQLNSGTMNQGSPHPFSSCSQNSHKIGKFNIF